MDRAVSLWAGVIAPFMTPADAVVPTKGREVLTAIIAAPSGLALHEAYEHHLEVWRQSDEGQEVLGDFNNVDVNQIEPLDIRHFLSGQYDSPAQDPSSSFAKR